VHRPHNPRDLVNHVLGHVAARELPEQPPVDELVAIERSFRSAVQEGVPLNGCRSAIRGNLANPLTLASRSVPAHPRFYGSNLAYQAILEPGLRVDQLARALMLQANSNDAIRLAGCFQTSFGFGDRPGHRLLAVKVLARSEHVLEVPRVAMQRRRNEH